MKFPKRKRINRALRKSGRGYACKRNRNRNDGRHARFSLFLRREHKDLKFAVRTAFNITTILKIFNCKTFKSHLEKRSRYFKLFLQICCRRVIGRKTRTASCSKQDEMQAEADQCTSSETSVTASKQRNEPWEADRNGRFK